jgi:hypothetical protein
VGRYRVTFRQGPQVEHERFDAALDAVIAIEARLRRLGPNVLRETRSFITREFTPAQQVAVRAELKGPRGLRAGIDLRGDGSTQAWIGRLGRRLIEPEPGEDAYAALRRVSCPA